MGFKSQTEVPGEHSPRMVLANVNHATEAVKHNMCTSSRCRPFRLEPIFMAHWWMRSSGGMPWMYGRMADRLKIMM